MSWDPARDSVAQTRTRRAHEAMLLLLDLHDAFPNHWAATVARYPATAARLRAALTSEPRPAVHAPVTGPIRTIAVSAPTDLNELDDPEVR